TERAGQLRRPPLHEAVASDRPLAVRAAAETCAEPNVLARATKTAPANSPRPARMKPDSLHCRALRPLDESPRHGGGNLPLHLAVTSGDTDDLPPALPCSWRRRLTLRRAVQSFEHDPSANVELPDCQEDTCCCVQLDRQLWTAFEPCWRTELMFRLQCERMTGLFTNETSLVKVRRTAQSEGHIRVHPAALRHQKGYMAVTNVLLKLGAECYVLNLDFSSPLHFAARYADLTLVATGRVSRAAPGCEGRHAKVVGLLLQRGSVLLKDTNGKHSLHLVAKQGHIDVAKLILAVNHGNYRRKNRLEVVCPVPQSFKTPTVCCFLTTPPSPAKREVVAAVIQHERWKEILWNVGPNHCPIFETGQVPAGAMLMFDQVDLLTHPLCTAYLSMKWRQYGCWFHNINLLLYILFLAAITTFVSIHPVDTAHGGHRID
uniref:ANK_REP_REGION domain-containing protein n=1 Tax=Macrostomum lignano TaxID=282301 RepID=A0A1I8FMW0_9PLAT